MHDKKQQSKAALVRFVFCLRICRTAGIRKRVSDSADRKQHLTILAIIGDKCKRYGQQGIFRLPPANRLRLEWSLFQLVVWLGLLPSGVGFRVPSKAFFRKMDGDFHRTASPRNRTVKEFAYFLEYFSFFIFFF